KKRNLICNAYFVLFRNLIFHRFNQLINKLLYLPKVFFYIMFFPQPFAEGSAKVIEVFLNAIGYVKKSTK
ncbi:hypothetical protein, partial [Flammeovirga sp. EKP202]|uniref:hypothetical protein n=1 Tax=Flammeovirga sp. EKP202 TaxID=2770592 RepID=UPI001CB7C55A